MGVSQCFKFSGGALQHVCYLSGLSGRNSLDRPVYLFESPVLGEFEQFDRLGVFALCNVENFLSAAPALVEGVKVLAARKRPVAVHGSSCVGRFQPPSLLSVIWISVSSLWIALRAATSSRSFLSELSRRSPPTASGDGSQAETPLWPIVTFAYGAAHSSARSVAVART